MLRVLATGPDLPLDPSLDVDATFRKYRRRIIVAITAGYALSYTCRLAINVVKKPLIDGGIFTARPLGTIGVGAVLQLCGGQTGQRVRRRPRQCAAVLCDRAGAVGAVQRRRWAFRPGVVATIFWGLNGWFQSYGAPACVIALAGWFSNRERGRYYGIWTTSHSLGEGLTFAAVAALAGAFGWHWGFWGPAARGDRAAIVCYFVMADRPRTLGLPTVGEWRSESDPRRIARRREGARGAVRAQLQILKIPAVWIVAVSSALVYVTRYAINSWGILYLQEARGYSLLEAGSMMAASTVAGIVGAVAFGFISDKWFGARRPPANLLFALVEIAGLLLFFYGPQGTAWLVFALILFGLGMTGLVTSVGGLFAVDICPKRVAGAALGMTGVFSYLGAAMQERVSGQLIDQGMTMVGGVRHYDFAPVIGFWIGSSIVSMLLVATLWRTRTRD